MKIAVVTGASSGLGREFVLQIAGKEDDLDEIWVIARRRERLEELRRECPVSLCILAMDLTSEDAAGRLEQELKKREPEITILVNAAGFGKIGSFREITRQESSAMVRLNCQAAVEAKAFLYRYSRGLRWELSGSGINVTAVCPYWIRDTEFISAAEETDRKKAVRHFPFASRVSRVAAWALSDSRLGLAVSTPGMAHRLAAKFLPADIMMAIWELIRRI